MTDSQIGCYEKLEKISEGAFGVVYKAKNKISGQIVALKKVKISDNKNEGVLKSVIREISILKDLNHENIVKLIDTNIQQDKMYLTLEYFEFDLYKYMKSNIIDEKMIKKYLLQMVKAIQHCHSNRVIHRDIKPANILIDREGNLKLADFGLARIITNRAYTAEVITMWYRAPEILLGCHNYSTPIDIWSIGCVFAEMVLDRPLFPGDSEMDQLYRIFRECGTPTEETWPGVTSLSNYKTHFPCWKGQNSWIDKGFYIKTNDRNACDLFRKMLIYDPNCRINSNQILDHGYFK